jgi:hypothetical protein
MKKGGVMNMVKGLFLTLTCFLLVLLPAFNGVSQAACTPAVQIVETGGTATTIQGAYDTASSTMANFTLRLAGEIFTENLALDGGAVILDGGYDCSFTNKISTTGIFGTVTISAGSANFAGDVGVVSTTQCEFDRDLDFFSSIGSCGGTANDCNDYDPLIFPGAVEITATVRLMKA